MNPAIQRLLRAHISVALLLLVAGCSDSSPGTFIDVAAAPAEPLASPAMSPAGEFDGMCATGLADGKRINTHCSIHWIDKDGKKYCFGNEDARTVFLENPHVNIEKARDFLATAEIEASANAMSNFDSDTVKAFVAEHVAAATQRGGGVFKFRDVTLDQQLELVYVELNLMRTLDGFGYFPDLVFHAKDDPAKKYWIDFWIKPRDGKLKVIDTRIYKGPKKSDSGWTLQTRQPRPWWWIPASEHPGKMEMRRGWEVMSAMEEHIVAERAANGGKYKLKDPKTGKVLSLDFIGTHLPIRKLAEDGRYFACTDFREEGTRDQYYDIDFWLDEKTGKMTVGEVRVHKVPVEEDGSWVQVPRYTFDDLKFDVVP